MNEIAARPLTAVSVSKPAVASIWNWTPAPIALPPGRLSVTELPARPAVTTANQPFARSASRCSPKLQPKDATSAASATLNQMGSRVVRRGQAPSTFVIAGNST